MINGLISIDFESSLKNKHTTYSKAILYNIRKIVNSPGFVQGNNNKDLKFNCSGFRYFITFTNLKFDFFAF